MVSSAILLRIDGAFAAESLHIRQGTKSGEHGNEEPGEPYIHKSCNLFHISTCIEILIKIFSAQIYPVDYQQPG